jgi:hypothetical protein
MLFLLYQGKNKQNSTIIHMLGLTLVREWEPA